MARVEQFETLALVEHHGVFARLGAVVTPDASPVTMVLMFAALIALYEVALAIARYAIVARDGKAALKWTREDYEEHEFEKE